MSKEQVEVNENGAFEILIADCLRTEPFPSEIQVVGKAIGWTDKMKICAENRGWTFTFSITDK